MIWLVTILALVGTIANIQKKRWCFICWLISNTTFSIYDFSIGAPAQGTLFAIYAGLAIWGIIKWKE